MKREDDYVGEFSQCGYCKNHIDGLKCKAFDIIPDEIFFNELDHDKIIEGQKGDFVFESKLKESK